MPIHIRAETDDGAEAFPGDPLRARYMAETYLDGAVETNAERGLLDYTGHREGGRVSVQGTGMGGPGATIVFAELIQLGAKSSSKRGILAVEMEAAALCGRPSTG